MMPPLDQISLAEYRLSEMTSVETTIPLPETLKDLDLHEGDRLVGQVRNGKLVLRTVVKVVKKKATEGFGSRWRGQFKEVKETDFSDDPRALRILNH